MTPQQFTAIFANLGIQRYEDALSDIKIQTINQWLDGTIPIPKTIEAKLLHLNVVHELLKMEALEEAFDAPEQMAYWPVYLRPADFEAIDPKRYEFFLGCQRAYNEAIYKAVDAFMYYSLNEGYKPCSVRAYTLSTCTYFQWLEAYGDQNTEARRKQFTKESYLRNRPMRSDALRLHVQGKDIPRPDKEEVRKIDALVEGVLSRLELDRPPPVRITPTPEEVFEDFLKCRLGIG